jgi:hypothetical protein
MDLRTTLAQYTWSFDATSVPASDAADIVKHAAAIKNMAATLETMAAARVAQSGAWRFGGHRTPADWLAAKTGTSKSQARTQIETGQRLEQLETVADAAKRGELSPAQTTVIADAAAASPEKEEELVDAARRESVGELRDRCQSIKAAADPDPDATWRRHRARRFFRRWTDPEGVRHAHGASTPDQMAILENAVDPIIDELFKAARAEGQREPREAYALDALIELARRASGASPATTSARRRGRFRALIRVDHSALDRGVVTDDETCEIAGIGPVPVSIARDLLGEAVLHLVITKGVDVANVTYLGRGPNAAQKIALAWTSPVCTRLGCDNRVFLEFDHTTDYSVTRHTRLDDGKMLCSFDHHLKTVEGGSLFPVPASDPWSLLTIHAIRATPTPHPRHEAARECSIREEGDAFR